jgi:hypothetical protein
MDRVLNFALIANPANWIIVLLILYVVGLVAKVLFQAAQGQSILQLPQGL